MFRVIKNKLVRYRSFLVYLALVLALIFFIQIHLLFSTQYTLTDNRRKLYSIFSANRTKSIKGSVNSFKSLTRFISKTPKVSASTLKLKYRVGHVNVHLWYKMCTSTVDSLRQLPLFPLWPSVRGQPEMPNELVSIMSSQWSAQRVMGLLYPPLSGIYSFEITSGTISEFWLSTDEKPENAAFLAKNNKNRLFGVNFAKGAHLPNSKPVQLEKDRVYYFDIIHGMNDISHDQVQVRWMMPGAKSYTAIPKIALSTVIVNDTSLDMNTRQLVKRSPSLTIKELTLKKHVPHKWANLNFSKPFSDFQSYTRENIHTLEFGDGARIMTAFDECEYLPSYTKRRVFKRYQGVYWTHFNDVFPNDRTDGKIWQGFHELADRQGNKLIPEGVVVDVVKMFMAQLNSKYPGEYTLANVVSVERNVDEILGNRFLLELVVQEMKTKKLQRISEYVYQFKNHSDVLCKPKGLSWSPTTKIYAIITTKNQGPWVIHYIQNMAHAVHAHNDDNVHFVIVDYGNNGISIEDELIRNGLKHYTIIKKTGKFHKTLAIDEAVKSIKDDHSIVFLTDLHLDVPKDLFENVRKHTIQGKMTFTPVVFRLKHCGRPESDQTTTTGYWDSYAFGIFSTFKSDWKHFGGLNVELFKNKWGGEDWEMVDRVLANGLEIDRIRLPFFYHFFHDKVGMWEQA